MNEKLYLLKNVLDLHPLLSYTHLSYIEHSVSLHRSWNNVFLYSPVILYAYRICIIYTNAIQFHLHNQHWLMHFGFSVYPETLSWQGYFKSRFKFSNFVLKNHNYLYIYLNVLVKGYNNQVIVPIKKILWIKFC